MRRFFVLLVVLSIVSGLLATTVGAFMGKEIGGRNRMYIGGVIKTGDILGLGFDVIYPIKTFSSMTNELSEANTLELDPYVYLNFDLGMKVYMGIGTMIVMDINTFKFSLFSKDMLRGKLGVSFDLKGVTLFLEGISAFSYSPIASTGIYGVHGGIGLNF